MQTTTTPPEDERDPVTGEAAGGYEPPQDEPIPLATPKPKLKTLDKKKVGILAGVVGVLIAFVFISAFMPKPPQQQERQDDNRPSVAAKSETFNALPGDYSAAAAQRAQNVPQLGPPMPGEVGQMQYDAQQRAAGQAYGQPYGANNNQQLTAYQQALAQQELDRLKRAADARDAPSNFGGAGRSGSGSGAAGIGGYTPPSPDQLMRSAMAGMQVPGMPDPAAARDANNRQDDKRDFLKNEKGDGFVLGGGIMPPASPTVVSAGTMIPALFLTGINSDLPGQITAQVSQPVYDTPTGRHVIIPQGSVLIGAYDSRVTFGQNRVLLVWQRLRFPNGSSIDLEGMPGVDMSGYAGVRDKVNNHWGKVVSSVVLSSVLAAAVATSEGDSFSSFQRDAGQAAAQGAGQAVNSAGQQIVQRTLNVQPTLEVRPGQRVAVMVNKDMALAPYVE